MSKYMYNYIKGCKVLMEEHMLSATELAKIFGLYTLNDNPNAALISCILADYVKESNLNISEYYYPHSHGVMRVYPSVVYQKVLNDFVFDLKEDMEYSYIVNEANGKKRISYKYKQKKSDKIVSIKERRKANVRK